MEEKAVKESKATKKEEQDKPANIYLKMLKATEKINRVAKNLKVGLGQSQYKAVGESDVLEAVKPVEAEIGIYSFPVSRRIIESKEFVTTSEYNGKTSEKVTMFLRLEVVYRFVNVDDPSDYIDITTYGDGIDPQDKAVGKAMTYADKYALLKAYKVETGDDPDQHHSQDMKPNYKPQQQAKTNQTYAKANEPEPESESEDGPIDKNKVDALKMLADSKGVTMLQVLKRYNKQSASELLISEWMSAMKALEITKPKEKVDLGL